MGACCAPSAAPSRESYSRVQSTATAPAVAPVSTGSKVSYIVQECDSSHAVVFENGNDKISEFQGVGYYETIMKRKYVLSPSSVFRMYALSEPVIAYACLNYLRDYLDTSLYKLPNTADVSRLQKLARFYPKLTIRTLLNDPHCIPDPVRSVYVHANPNVLFQKICRPPNGDNTRTLYMFAESTVLDCLVSGDFVRPDESTVTARSTTNRNPGGNMSSYELLAWLIRVVTKRDLTEELMPKIFQSMHMESASFKGDIEALQPVYSYANFDTHEVTRVDMIGEAHNLACTLHDYARFLSAAMQHAEFRETSFVKGGVFKCGSWNNHLGTNHKRTTNALYAWCRVDGPLLLMAENIPGPLISLFNHDAEELSEHGRRVRRLVAGED